MANDSQNSSTEHGGVPPADFELNVGRTRITVLTLNLALYLFAAGVLIDWAQEVGQRPGWMFLTSFVAIASGFSLALVALMLFLLCQRLNRLRRLTKL